MAKENNNQDTAELLKEIKEKRLAQQEKKKLKTEEMTNTAYDMIYDPETKMHSKVVIEYNLETKKALVKEIVPLTTTRYRAIFDFENELQKKLNKELK